MNGGGGNIEAMHCIFCKRDSTGSRSEEHIIPESLGNEEHVLPPGVVCDACNNYFASSIEQVVLESGEFKTTRFSMVIPNKRNRVPSVDGMLLPLQPGMTLGQAARFHRADVSRNPEDGSYNLFPEDAAAAAVADCRITRMIIPATGPKPDRIVFARFLGKVAVEAMAARLLKNAPEMLEEFVQDDQIDILRNYARYGKQGLEWPYSERRIYPADFSFPTPDGDSYEVLHEFDFLHTEQGEMYFVLAILGTEYAINMAGPDFEGYTQLLTDHGGISPLYQKRSFPD
jgi:hypothetical protein